MEYTEIVAWVKDALWWLWGQWETKTLLYLIAGNFIVAVAVGVSTGQFRLGKLAEVLYRKILPWLGVYAFFAFTGEAVELQWVSVMAWGLLTTKLLGDLLDSLGQLGIFKDKAPIPPQLTK